MATSPVLTCRHCGNISKMEILSSAHIDETWGDSEMGYGPDQSTSYDIVECPACENRSIISYFWSEDMDEHDVEYKYLFPAEATYPVGLPDDILKRYKAAEKLKKSDPNAYAASMRRLLEKICLEHGAKSKTLGGMLKQLADRNEIPEKLVKVAYGLKDFGNKGAHAGTDDVSKAETNIISALSKALLEYIYSAPHLASVAEEKLRTIKT